MEHYIAWRAALYWIVGFSNELSGEEMATPMDELYEADYESGRAAARDKKAGR